jgi:hypothetical protein
MAIVGHTVTPQVGKPFTIFGETDNINYFLDTPLTPDAAQGAYNVTSSVKSHTRRQYPGDVTLINVSSHPRVSLVDPSQTSGNALPGRPFVLAEVGGDKQRRQFTLKGQVIDLHSFLSSEAAFDLNLHTSSGAKKKIAAAV